MHHAAASPRLQALPPLDGAVAPDWQALWAGFCASATGRALRQRLQQRLSEGAVVYPPQPLRALELTPLAEVRVVILGQDPYHGPGQAEGLAFSVADGQRLPPSLRNLYQELARDLDGPSPASGSLVDWARQGVLLLNTCLTVEEGAAASHAGWGWEAFTEAVLQACSDDTRPKVFLLWGRHAQALACRIDARRHAILSANHPSPLSARRGPQPFIGCGHFSQANHWLGQQQQKKIDWLCKTPKQWHNS